MASVGVSFFVLQAIGFLIDAYEGTIQALPPWPSFAAYMCFFPHLLAGPICRANQLIPQLEKRKKFHPDFIYDGVKLFSLGLFKKNVLANFLGLYVTPFFDQAPSLPLIYTSWMSLLCFSFQIYFDFSGYTQMAQGIAKIFGIDLPLNFQFPYTAASLKDFWHRWHISLSQWLRDYIYIPLGGNRQGDFQTVICLGLTMLVSGLWHGLAANFLLWAIYHWFFLSLEKLARIDTYLAKRNSQILRVSYSILVFIIISLGWVLFRTHSLPQALSFYGQLVSLPKGYSLINFVSPYRFVLGVLCFSMAFCQLERRASQLILERRLGRGLEIAATAVLLFLAIIFRSELGEFIYFQF